MNAEPGQLFFIEDYHNATVIWSAFKTKEVVMKGPYHVFEFYRKLKQRNIGMFIRSRSGK